MKPFNVLRVPLNGSNLIEASAGTGKTYSIAVLVLRMIIEKSLTISQILIVTFTNAAVAELEVRIRFFVRQAYNYTRHRGDHIDQNIKTIVDRAMLSSGLDRETVPESLAKAVRDLDDTQIMTIHGFCQQTLQEFAFETEQAFDVEVLTDQTLLNKHICNRFWREEISVLDPELLELLFYKKVKFPFTKDTLTGFVNQVLSGRTLRTTPGQEAFEDTVLEKARQCLDKTKEAYRLFYQMVESQFPLIKREPPSGTYARDLVEQSSTVPDFIWKFEKKWGANYLVSSFPRIAQLYESFIEQQQGLISMRTCLVERLLLKLQEVALERMNQAKERKNVVGFDDLINSLWKAVKKENVCRLLREKYAAVFIDEFQDTDKAQYEIFHDIFSAPAVQQVHDHVVFYIGDPKQSIFGWRKADLSTYKRAREQVESVYTMNSNYRSTPRLIHALNRFFSLENAFLDPEIRYYPVDAGTDRPEMTAHGKRVAPLCIVQYENQETLMDMVCNKIVGLLSCKEHLIPCGAGNWRQIRPSDIGIIVRMNKQAKKIRNELARRNVPAVTLDDTRVLSSPQALQIYYVLLAIRQPGRVSLAKALLNPYFGFDTQGVIRMDEETELERFRELHQIWGEWGIYNALSSFLRIYRVRYHCTLEGNLQGQRAITNYLHIMELLHKAETRSSLSADELISWLSREITADNPVEDEYQQRIESDENAVQVTTIHKAKGLSYGIVFAPYLNMNWTEHEFLDFQLPPPQEAYVVAINKTEEFVEMAKNQAERENRRLIYVTLTRAVYKCFVYTRNKASSLKPFLDALPADITDLIESDGQTDDKAPKTWAGGQDYSAVKQLVSRNPRDVPPMKGAWGVHSFSSLVSETPYVPVQVTTSARGQQGAASGGQDIYDRQEKRTNLPAGSPPGSAEAQTAYDAFIFDRLPRGAKTGVFIHQLFQQLIFDDPGSWAEAVDRAVKAFPHCCQEQDKEHLLTMINHVLHVRIGEDLVLSQVHSREKAQEMAFFYTLQDKGLMMGFMDLFFCYNNKFYILDWKSNHLGHTPEDYNAGAIDRMVKESRYDLQYNIYTTAALRHLKCKIRGFDASRDFGGVVYLFIRGIRAGLSHGVYLRTGAQVLGQPFFSTAADTTSTGSFLFI